MFELHLHLLLPGLLRAGGVAAWAVFDGCGPWVFRLVVETESPTHETRSENTTRQK